MDNNIDEIINTLIDAKYCYYRGEPEMSDNDFDELEEKLRILDPNNDYFKMVGYVLPDEDGNIRHSSPMLSVKKFKNIGEIKNWYTGFRLVPNIELIGEPKVDGVSCNIVYKNGKLVYGVTRGDGIVGKLINFINPDIENLSIPKTIPIKGVYEIRGELYIPKEFGKTVFKDMPLRNICAGIVRSGENAQYISFLAYQINKVEGIYEFSLENDILKSLILWKFKTIPSTPLYSIDDIEFFIRDYNNALRDSFEFETDGVVIIINDKSVQCRINEERIVRSHNYYNFCIKPPSKTSSTTLLGIEINVSKAGRLIPVALITPTIIDNVTYDRATLNNYEFMRAFGSLYVGNTVLLRRCNDVIPGIVSIEPDGDIKNPIIVPTRFCPSCGKPIVIEGKHMVCNNLECPGRSISEIFNWVLKRRMKDIGIKFLELAYKENIIKNIPDFYNVNLRSKLEKFYIPGGGKIKKIMSAIEKSKENVADIDILASIGIPGIGRVVLENLGLTNIDTLPEDVVKKDNSDLAVYRYISDWLTLPNNYSTLISLKKVLKSKSFKINNSQNKSVCITGSFDIGRDDIEKLLKNKGYKIDNTVTKNTDYLIVGDSPGESKLEKAKNYTKVKIVNIKEFL